MNGKIKLFLIILTFFSNSSFKAQDFRIFYDYSFKKDSTNLNLIENELMVLDVSKVGSVFYSLEKFKYDSISLEKNKNREYMTEDTRSKISFFVQKNYDDYQKNFNISFGGMKYSEVDTTKIKWKLLSETKILKGYMVQLATTSFGGRKWNAWYTPELSIIDGPFKFEGLPGLILEIEDTKGDHGFEFIGIEKNAVGYTNFYNLQNPKEKVFSLNGSEFNKAWNAHKKDPAKNTKFNLLNSKYGFSLSYDGKTITTEDIIRDREKAEKEKIKNNNNFIELTLYR